VSCAYSDFVVLCRPRRGAQEIRVLRRGPGWLAFCNPDTGKIVYARCDELGQFVVDRTLTRRMRRDERRSRDWTHEQTGMARCFASHFADASVIGVDIRDDYVVYAQGRAREDGLQNVEFRQGSVFDLPFANATFDVVWSKYVMQWINDPEKAVAEFRRVTRPGGVVVCCNFDGFAITHYPEDESLQRHILTVFPRLVDVNIGRKTAPIFHECA
jgi:SAM-dependent methyltransferase